MLWVLFKLNITTLSPISCLVVRPNQPPPSMFPAQISPSLVNHNKPYLFEWEKLWIAGKSIPPLPSSFTPYLFTTLCEDRETIPIFGNDSSSLTSDKMEMVVSSGNDFLYLPASHGAVHDVLLGARHMDGGLGDSDNVTFLVFIGLWVKILFVNEMFVTFQLVCYLCSIHELWFLC